MIFPDEKSSPKTLGFRWSTLRILFVLAILIVTLVVWQSATYFLVARKALQYNKLKAEYDLLLQQVQKLDEYERELQKLKQYSRKIRSLLSNYIQISEADTAISTSLLSGRDFLIESIYENIPSMAPVKGYVSRGFETDSHPAVDIAAPAGTPVVAVSDGRVVFSGWDHEYGYSIVLYHGFGFFSVYKHNQRNIVKDNELVRKGQVIALLGGSGELSTGPHLHLEIWYENRPENPLNYIGLINN